MNKKKQTLKYILSDILTATIVWFLLNILRYYEIAQYEAFTSIGSFLKFGQVIKVQIIVPLFWIILYYFSGYYNQVFGKSRISELFTTFISVSIGVVLIFFIVVLNDLPKSFEIYYTIFFAYYFLQFFCTYICRYLITSHALRRIQRHEWAQNVLIIGTGKTSEKAHTDISNLGYRVAGFIQTGDLPVNIPSDKLLGTLNDLTELIAKYKIDKLIVVPESENEENTVQTLYSLYHYKRPIKVWIKKNASLFRTEVKTIHGFPLIDVTSNNFSEAGKNIKYASDKIISLFALIFLSPLYAYIAIGVKLDSKGSVFFKQERIGYMGRPFTIYKFRTMYVNSVEQEPLLTNKNDKRVTRFGRFLRKYRLDEIPQFWNVLKGDMSIVGPRPEQRYYIDQIVKKAPYYYLLHNVRPGITSWGMVKYGYAETVDKMIERLNYDIMYYENMSLTLDLTILIYTIKIVFTGKGV